MSELDYNKVKAWPFQEALKIQNKIQNKEGKNTITFETGYGPSGVPHIGTFAEVLRTNMVKNALQTINNVDSKLITFSDDLDALKKVPEDYPFPDKLSKYINFPLSSIPDFTGKYESYADRNNNLLKDFLNNFDFKYEFISSTVQYHTGNFDSYLLKILENYEDIINLVLPTLRKERRESYSPFLPICKKTGTVLEVPVSIIDKKLGIISYKNKDNKYVETSVLKGKCKLQWKVDWAMRWSALDVDYEMNGKDLIPSFELSKQISKFINHKVPINMNYELFLDQNGEKISKSKGNGLSIEDWLSYGTKESLSIFMYQQPRRAKKLYFDCIPKSMDEYKKYIDTFYKQKDSYYDNPVWHIHEGKVPNKVYPIEFTSLLNLVTALNTNNKKTIIEFSKIYLKRALAKEEEKELEKITILAISYFEKFILPTLSKIKPNEQEKSALEKLIKAIQAADENLDAETYQGLIYKFGKEIYPQNLRQWFISLYKILFGSDSGPRLGSFLSLHSKTEVINILKEPIHPLN